MCDNTDSETLYSLTWNNYKSSTASNITVIEPECDDNDDNEWKYEGVLITCKELCDKEITD